MSQTKTWKRSAGYKYKPEDFAGWKWDYARAYTLFRAYNYPHQSVVYYSMYRLARDHPNTVTSKEALWYLEQVANTVRGAWSPHGGKWYMQQGLMAGSVWKDVVRDLDLEAAIDPRRFAEPAKFVKEVMANRTLPGRGVTYYAGGPCPHSDGSPFQACSCVNCTTSAATNPCAEGNFTKGVVFHCKSFSDNPLPYGSEFSWDSTGQEEAYVWGRYVVNQ